MLARLPARTPWRAFAPRRAEPRASWVVSKSSTVGLVDRSRSGLLERSGVAADRIVRAIQPRELRGGVREGALDERGGLRLQPVGVGQAGAVGVADRHGQRGEGLVALRVQRRQLLDAPRRPERDLRLGEVDEALGRCEIGHAGVATPPDATWAHASRSSPIRRTTRRTLAT